MVILTSLVKFLAASSPGAFDGPNELSIPHISGNDGDVDKSTPPLIPLPLFPYIPEAARVPKIDFDESGKVLPSRSGTTGTLEVEGFVTFNGHLLLSWSSLSSWLSM